MGKSSFAATALALLLSGCNTLVDSGSDLGLISRTSNEHGAAYAIAARPLIPNAELQLTAGRSISLEALLAGAAVYYFVDPLAPNWKGELRRLSDDTYAIALRMKRFKTGGDGEGVRAFHRNAERIVSENGYAGYTVLSLTEGIESETLGAVRVSEGIIRVTRAPAR
jgi:hypothetical protein